MALLTGVYKNPQANILYGSGSNKFTPEQIKSYITAPGRTDDDVLGRALAEGVSVNEISQAMAGDPRYSPDKIDSYLSGKGITKDLAEAQNVPTVSAPPPVKANPIVVGSKESMAGHMKGLLENPNNPLNVQAQTFANQQSNKRGLLSSSIAVSAAQDAMMKNAQPIASQDASTNYDAAKTNVGNALTAGMFNNDLASRVGMFNAGTEKDIGINTQNRQMDYYIANMDADNKMAVARVQAAANDSGIMGDLGKSMMNLYQQTAADPNISPEVKTQIFNTLKTQFEQVSSLLPSFESIGKNLSFGSASTSGGTSYDEQPGGLLTSGSATGGGAGSSPKLKSSIEKINVLGYEPEPHILAGVAAYERAAGVKVDRSLVVPEQLLEDFRYLSPGGFTNSYLSGDGTSKIRNFTAYDFPELIKATGNEESKIDGLQKLFVPVTVPGSRRADNIMFYVWNTDMLNKMK